ncbi:hypothetical protein PPROV_000717000 [Pycnococcus provasolii]|uniref:Methyltransferase domain-containing protein n=1 Tax=Pycnococcus provasolii TaxID=41880 RepID=A0A830HSI0_9CHLO|nr:hypothetical protein PPROV_000717000 [Pycnococcus provasolii]
MSSVIGALSNPKRTYDKVVNDLTVLKSIWLKPLAPADADHASRLDHFYRDQAHAYDGFRSNFLWGRRPMLAACAARLEGKSNLVWVDMGGGTGENVALMAEFIDLSAFSAIYVVDLTPSLVEVARKKVKAKGWTNVFVEEGDATSWHLPLHYSDGTETKADLVTFSYSLSMMPPFHAAVDNAVENILDEKRGLLGVTDFFVSGRFDLPQRQHSYLRRVLWQAVFDQDGIALGPERRAYLDHKLNRVMEHNSDGTIPYVPGFMRAPYYVWLGCHPRSSQLMRRARSGIDLSGVEEKFHRPALFPPTFLYSISWEDPRADDPAFMVGEGDVVLTLTGGGCNAMDMTLSGAARVVCVDMNPAQGYLLELKLAALRNLSFDDAWKLLGEGKHENIEKLYLCKLAPFMSQGAKRFWGSRLHMLDGKNKSIGTGLYLMGSMGWLVYFSLLLQWWIWPARYFVRKLVSAPTLEDQRKLYNQLTPNPNSILGIFHQLMWWVLRYVLLNHYMLWLLNGVPKAQSDLIKKHDGRSIIEYAQTTFNGAALNTHIRTQNYFYLLCMIGKFTKECCPRFLKPAEFEKLKADENRMLDSIEVVTGKFKDALLAGVYTRVILMDHMDWMDASYHHDLASTLRDHVSPGGRVIWRSSSIEPPYSKVMEQYGFEVRRVSYHDKPDACIDAVNMYASFWVGVRK